MYISASGLVVKSSVAIVGPRVRFSAGALYVLCIRQHGADMSQNPTFGCVMLVPLATRFCTMSPTCRPTCRRHVGPDISCLTFWTSGRHANIRHIPTKNLVWPHSPTNEVRGASILLRLAQRSRYYCTMPKKCLSHFTPVGSLIASIACTLLVWCEDSYTESLCCDSAFAHKKEFYIFKFPKRFSEISWREISQF